MIARNARAYPLAAILLFSPQLARSAFVAPPLGRASTTTTHRAATPTCAADALEKRQRTRFAPSPTGSLHVGGARTALFSWLRARQADGDFIIRVEDTDTARSTRESEASVLQDLRWLGLLWDEGPEVGGEKGPYRQSERMGSGLYQELADRLMKEGHAYPCFCTAEELDLKRKAAEAAGENPQYDGTWRDADPAEVQKRLDAGEPYTVRFKVPRGKKITISDLVRGEVTWDVQATVGDFILLRSAEGTAEAAGMPVYNFCVAVDDALMDVTTVIRAEEHLTNTVRQILILEALGYDVPKYAHLSLVLGEDRSKLSKRHGATSVDQFRKEGFLPEAMVNYLCLLGWNDDTEQDIYSVGELTDAFSLDRVTKSPAVFDMKKLRWVNGQHLRALPPDEFAALLAPQLHELGVTTAADVTPFVHAASAMVAEKVELLNDAAPLVTAAMDFPLAETIKSLPFSDATLNLHAVGNAVVDAYRGGTFPDPAADGFDAAWKAWAKGVSKELGVKGKGLFLPLRVATTGSESGPDIPAQLRTVALAGGQVACPVVPLADRIDQLEAALSKMTPPPPTIVAAEPCDVAGACTLEEKLELLEACRAGGALSKALYEEAKRELMPEGAAAPSGAAAAAAASDEPPTFGKLDIRVGKIVEAWEHPDSEKLWVEKIDVGDEGGEPRQIASGLRAHYATAADLEGREVIVVCNLKEAKLGGVPSNGMVLCASGADGTVAFVEPPAGAAPGERVVVEGMMEDAAKPNAVKKKKLMEKTAEELRAIDNVACYRGVPLSTAAGPCTIPAVASGTIN